MNHPASWRISGSTRLAGVLGWPITHTLSPVMHNAAFRALGLDAVYLPLGVRPRGFVRLVRSLAEVGALGVNVTLPHKERAFALCEKRTVEAERIGAVNTLVFRQGRVLGDNTDGRGLLHSLRGRVRLRGARALVLGCGGAGRAVAVSLAGAGTGSLTLVDVSPARRRRVAAVAERAGGAAVKVLGPEDRRLAAAAAEADLVVNATPLGWRPSDPLPLPPRLLSPRTCVMDLVYGRGPTRWLGAARRRGCRTVAGWEMLLHQGALSFALWTGRKAPIAVMRRALLQAGV